ncbi:MAG: RNA polymerase factor sigma-54, partial [Alphaproteobacteria bacterium]
DSAEDASDAEHLASWSSLPPRAGGHGESDLDWAERVSSDPSLREHLTEQVMVNLHDPAQRLIAAHLVDLVDEAGYLPADALESAQALGASEAEILDVYRQLQGFDPTGVFARSLRECLSLQLAESDRLDPAMHALLDNLDVLAVGDVARLRRICGVDDEDLRDMIAELRRLDPKPGLRFGSEPVQPLVPDIYVRQKADGSWHVELNTENLPRVLVNSRYYSEVLSGAASRDARSYITECLSSANWLVKSLAQRAKTILKVSSEIVRQQDEFLVHGVRRLRPLNLRDVADAIGMHESTVSRVTSNKYMATPRGVFELKYFFTGAIASTGGGSAHSSEAVRHEIRRLIDKEDPRDVLSDDRIVELLKRSGIEIARRTVAKYRESMGIPSSVRRRQSKRASA